MQFSEILEALPHSFGRGNAFVKGKLNIRMGNRRFTRLTNAFSQKVDNHLHMLSLYFVHYDFCQLHKSLRMAPAMYAGISETLRDMDWVVSPVDARAPQAGAGRIVQEKGRMIAHWFLPARWTNSYL
ncbi:hypothetical protein PZ897_09910 [Hoeflea sp. YIM 152468]|uniref:hypothetical protein n=1 Tax=Hoeflea sp. YIM 152468 TaxID=3031759 RepID=UPI0023DCDAB0|nr:hypothetical protein [Hoeflea sp. YIM 152468]MDF1608490.1 hypothetical protein [Hoeflea sp. YIM 152468]